MVSLFKETFLTGSSKRIEDVVINKTRSPVTRRGKYKVTPIYNVQLIDYHYIYIMVVKNLTTYDNKEQA
jgi:hypothetical protein